MKNFSSALGYSSIIIRFISYLL